MYFVVWFDLKLAFFLNIVQLVYQFWSDELFYAVKRFYKRENACNQYKSLSLIKLPNLLGFL